METIARLFGTLQIADGFLALSVLFAFLCGVQLVVAAAPLLGFRSAARDAVPSALSRTVPDFLVRGVPLFRPAARVMLRSGQVRSVLAELRHAARERGVVCGEESLASAAAMLLTTTLLLAWVLSGSFASALLLAVVLCVLAWYGAKNRRAKRLARMQDDIPAALESLSDCVQAGYSLHQSFRRVSEDIGGSVGALFERAAQRLDAGCTVSQALEVFREAGGSAELAYVSVVLDVQHLSGGSVSGLIETAREGVQERIGLSRELRVKTAQARLSAQVVSVMPFVLLLMLSVVGEGFLDPFFESPAGWALLLLALLMQFAGIAAVRGMLRVKGVEQA